MRQPPLSSAPRSIDFEIAPAVAARAERGSLRLQFTVPAAHTRRVGVTRQQRAACVREPQAPRWRGMCNFNAPHMWRHLWPPGQGSRQSVHYKRRTCSAIAAVD